MNNTLSIAIASDLHCTLTTQTSISYLLSDLPKKPINKHPVESIKKVIKEEGITADLLLCPGDIADKVSKQGMISGWQFLQDIKLALNNASLVATLGNHDVDSRNQHNSGPFEFIKNLVDFKPTEDEVANDSYWRNHFCILHKHNYILLIINSCFSHTNETLAKASQISPAMLEKIDEELHRFTGTDLVKIAMCHHHPIHHSNTSLEYKDSDFIDQSDKLLSILERHKFNLVIHGHKHEPRLVNFNSLPIFACGSFSSMANLLDIGCENTFHYITIDTNSKKGTIKTWIYKPFTGWSQKHGSYFPCLTGFGFQSNMENLANECHTWFLKQGKDSVSYTDLLKKFPDISYMIPSDQTSFNKLITDKYGLAFSPNLPNIPDRLYNLNA
jgi:UDP-2,3-diacylglucosamine pyrophosphatase LpxH